MKAWVVIEFDKVDVRLWQDPGPRYVPGGAQSAAIVFAETEDEAIDLEARRGGWYAAFPLPSLTPRKATLQLEAA